MKKIMLVGAALATFAAVPAMAQSFDGPYVGAQLGYNHDVAINSDKDAVVGGGFAGYDHEVSPGIVLGVEGGFSLAASDRIGPAGTDAATIDPHYSFDVSARAGYVVGDSTLIYARGGYANARARFTQTVNNVVTSDTQNLDGWFVGGGVERNLYGPVSARVEYRFSDFDGDGSKFQRHQVLTGIAYRF